MAGLFVARKENVILRTGSFANKRLRRTMGADYLGLFALCGPY